MLLLLLLLLEELFPVDEELGKRPKAGLLWLLWPRLRLRPLSFPLKPPLLTWFMSASSSLNGDVKRGEASLEADAVDELLVAVDTWLIGAAYFSMGLP